MVATKKILRYLKGTIEFGLTFGTNIIEATQAANMARGYANNNYTDNLSDRKSTIGYVFFIN